MKRTLLVLIFLIISFLLISCNFNNILIKNIIYTYNGFYIFENENYYIKIIYQSAKRDKAKSHLEKNDKTVIEIIPLKEKLIEKIYEIKYKDNIIIPKIGSQRNSLVAEILGYIDLNEITFYVAKEKLNVEFTDLDKQLIGKDVGIKIAENNIKAFMKANKIRKLEGDFSVKIIESDYIDYSYRYYITFNPGQKLFAMMIDAKNGEILAKNF